ncbi:hypothetical protein [Vibrio alginolyticus]
MSQQITPEEVVEMLAKVDVDGLIGKLERRNNKKEALHLRRMIKAFSKKMLLKTKEKFSIPPIYRKIFGDEAAKYIVLKGGRGSGKTFAIICYMLELSFEEKYRDSLFLVLR